MLQVLSVQIRCSKSCRVAFKERKRSKLRLVPTCIDRSYLGTTVGAILYPAFCLQPPDRLANRHGTDAKLTGERIDHQTIAWNIDPVQDTFSHDIVGLLLFVGCSDTHLSLLFTKSSIFLHISYTILYHRSRRSSIGPFDEYANIWHNI